MGVGESSVVFTLHLHKHELCTAFCLGDSYHRSWGCKPEEGLQIKPKWISLTVQIAREVAISKIILATKFSRIRKKLCNITALVSRGRLGETKEKALGQ